MTNPTQLLRARRGKYAFTLIEVLVVVAIIALLISILLPSLSRARAAAQGAVCKSQMRQLALATHLYDSDNRGALPGTSAVLYINDKQNDSRYTTNWDRLNWLGLRSERNAVAAGGPWGSRTFSTPIGEQYAQLQTWVAQTAPRNGTLFRYAIDPDIYLCPGDHQGHPDSEDPAGGGGNGTFSYTMTGFLGFKKVENCQRFTYVTDYQQSAGSWPPVVLDIPGGTTVKWAEADMILYVEEHPWNNTNQSIPSDSFGAQSYIVARHSREKVRGRTNIAFLDGHVEAKLIKYTGGGIGSNYTVGVDLWNKYRYPYDFDENLGGEENIEAFAVRIP